MDLQAASVSLGAGSLVWVQDPDVAWIDGEVLEVNGSDVKVLCTSGKTVSEHMGFFCRKEVISLFIQLTAETSQGIEFYHPTLSNTLVTTQSFWKC